MYHSLLLISSAVFFILGQPVYSMSLPSDDLDSLPVLFDDSTSSSSLFNDEDEFSTSRTAAIDFNSCGAVAAPDDLSLSPDETNLFSRREDNSAECLPPVNIGADTLQLFEAPLDSLENTILPFKGQIPDDPSPGVYPGRLPDGERGNYDSEEIRKAGWQPYEGAVRQQVPPPSDDCERLTSFRGRFPWELCCDSRYYAVEPSDEPERDALAMVDAWTRRNEDVAIIFDCICMFSNNEEGVFRKSFQKKSDANLALLPTVAIPNQACPYEKTVSRVCCNNYVGRMFSLFVDNSLTRELVLQRFNRSQLRRFDPRLSSTRAGVNTNRTRRSSHKAKDERTRNSCLGSLTAF